MAAATQISVTLSDGSTLTHLASVGDATAALSSAADLCAQIASYDSRPWADQIAFVTSIFSQISSFYQNANVSPQTDPVYVKWWVDNFANSASGVNYSDPAWSRKQGIGTITFIPYPNAGIGKRFIDAWNALGKYPINGTDRMLFMVVPRIYLDEQANIITQCVGGNGDQPPCDLFKMGIGLYGGCAQAGATREGCSHYDWNTFGWNDPLEFGIPAGPWHISGLPPLRWFAEYACDLVTRLQNRQITATDIVTSTWLDALNYSLLFNIKTARDAGVLPASLAAIAANLPAQRQLAQLNAQQLNSRVADTMAAMIPVMTAVAGPFGAVVGGIAGVFVAAVKIFTMLAPAATGCVTDPFGRCMPFALSVDITSNPTLPFQVPGFAERVGGMIRPTASQAAQRAGIQIVPASTMQPGSITQTGMSTGAKVAIGVAAGSALLYAVWRFAKPAPVAPARQNPRRIYR